MSAPVFSIAGKQVLRDGQHYADAADEAIAAELVDKLNRAEGDEADIGECMVKFLEMLDEADAATLGGAQIEGVMVRLSNGRSYRILMRRIPASAVPAGERVH